MNYGVYSSIAAQTLGSLGVCIVGLYLLSNRTTHRSFFKTAQWHSWSHHIKQGLLFLPSMLCAWIVASSDRLILAHYTTLHDVGIYAVADMFGQLFQSFFLIPLSGSYLPVLFQKYATHKNDLVTVEQSNQQTMWLALCGVGSILTISFFLGKGILVWFLPSHYHAAINYIWLLLMGYVFLMGNYFASALLIFKKKKVFVSCSLLLPAGLNIVLNIMLIPRYTVYGCVLATTISYVIYFAITVLYSRWVLTKECATQRQ